ncbi:MAG: phytanoyl-CoA dioxygenase [Rhodospirillaceae bacterium]|nr:phytanoyl-CoA dioxygenase [Rhodospirillaceae bacterium]|tara:strand:+ start:6022 stop:6828 length:807 start_codon:yes stop_codon:yes gene_type:complete
MALLERTTAPVGEHHAQQFARDGVLVVDDLISRDETARLRELVEPLYDGTVDTGQQRMDLGDFEDEAPAVERITQIMQVHDFVPEVLEGRYAVLALAAARTILGEDMELDMTMLMDKLPGAATPTPWHQDQAYWLPDIPDRRSLSVWLALENVTVESGCMAFVPGSHTEPTRPHTWAGSNGQALTTEVAAGEGVAVPLPEGGATFHHGNMLHSAGGNTTDGRRRALVLNYRSAAMIAWERERGYDHRSENARNEGEPLTRALHPGNKR